MKHLTKQIIGLVGIVVMTGCASVTQVATERDNNGIIRETKIKVTSTGNTKAIVESLRASNGKTQTLGAKGISEETNMQWLIELISAINKPK